MHSLIVNDFQTATFRAVEIPRPEPTANQVLVRIKATGVNLIDSKIRLFTLDTALSAHEAVEQGTAVIKIVIDLYVWTVNLVYNLKRQEIYCYEYNKRHHQPVQPVCSA